MASRADGTGIRIPRYRFISQKLARRSRDSASDERLDVEPSNRGRWLPRHPESGNAGVR